MTLACLSLAELGTATVQGGGEQGVAASNGSGCISLLLQPYVRPVAGTGRGARPHSSGLRVTPG